MESFAELQINPNLQKAVKELGYDKPTPIQAQALPILLGDSTDFIGLAATGTGKTAAFTLPILQRLMTNRHGVQALIMCPTRELCLQVAGQVNLLGKFMGVKAVPIYGGAGYEEQIRGLRSGAAIVVGTPGRIIDHIERHTLKLNNVHIVVLDEADEMISMGFKEDMETILKSVDKELSNRWLFSATMSPAIRRVSDQFLKNPQMVQVNRTEMLSSTVEQYFYMTHEANKPDVLCKLIDAAEDFYGVIFCQTKALVVELTRYLAERGYKSDSLHGDMSQSAREIAMQAFRDRRVRILICTDVASRGLDVKDITHVVNYSIPRELDSYVHRIGRTARSGKAGVALSLVTPSHRHLIGKIERLTKSKMNEGVIPTRKAIGIKKIALLLGQFQEQPGFERALEAMDDSWKNAVSRMGPEEVAARFLSIMYPWVFAEAKQVPMPAGMPRRPVGDRPSERSGGDRPRRPDFRSERRDDRRDDRRPAPTRRDDRPARSEARPPRRESQPVIESKREFKKPFDKFHKKKSIGGDAPPRRRP